MNSRFNASWLLRNCLKESSAKDRPPDYRGKVRDIYTLPGNRLLIVSTDRISAFDHIFAEPISFKGQLLNMLAWHGFQKIADLCPHHVLEVPHPNITIAKKCSPVPVEVVVRGYLSGHAWRTYSNGLRTLCGVSMPDGLRQNEAFPEPLLTPTTKAHEGHDEDISEAEILSGGLVSEDLWKQIRQTAIALYKRGAETARKQGLILVDTKYEFGLFDGKLTLMDEVHTPDSSRFFYADTYQECLDKGTPQKQLSKEFLREWLIQEGHHAHMDSVLPALPDTLRISIFERYCELFETLTGTRFEPVETEDFNDRLSTILESHSS
ncbi:phosphoribosylaminoimidazolesuccinocarboxamide synthase [Balneolaceae bacterium ANBcel3]|nr:phosphoribosylaminoimidazolesuccinocarboxamide synthase [Balneolaceae bacterium ANBcel3]